jgi:HlyD family secretion protein
MSKKVFNLIIVGIILAGTAVGVFLWKSLTSRPSLSQSSATSGNVAQTIDLSGIIKSQGEADLSFEINGKIEKIYKHAGDAVKQNDILAVMSNDDLKAEYSQSVSLARSAEGILNNYKDLQDREEYKLKALKSADAAKNDKKAQEEQIDAQKSLVGAQEDQVKAAWSNVAAKKALLDQATIRANFSGTVAAVNFSEGEVVTAGTPVLTLINNQNFEVEALATELDIKNIKIGQKGEIKTLENNDKTYSVQVIEINQVKTDGSGAPAYKIKLAVINPDEALNSGMEVSVNLEMAK